MILALAGGVGGAKLCVGLQRTAAPGTLACAVNTGDDFEHLGLHVSPDLDTVMYTLAGRQNPETGWGVAGETWSFMSALEDLGGATWFRLGDRDLATHVERTRRLHAGESLSAITADLCARLGIPSRVFPMSDEPVRTIVSTDRGALPFQEYFVMHRCAPRVSGFRFDGIEAARPSAALRAALELEAPSVIVLCPSNPFVSLAPILDLRGVRALLSARRSPVVAVSPIVGGRAIKGPAAKMMRELGMSPSVQAIAELYGDILDGLVIDVADAASRGTIRGPRVLVTRTVMTSDEGKAALAREVLDFAASLPVRGGN